MNLQQINLDLLRQRFYQKPRIVNIAKFILKYPQNDSSPDLEDLLRDYSEEPIEDDEEIDLRDDLDSLLAYYSLLEIAIQIGHIPTEMPTEIAGPASSILNQPDVRKYYQKHYRILLPELFRLRLLGRNIIVEKKSHNEAATIFSQFLFMIRWLENDKSVSTFLWFLDDGIQNGRYWTDLVKPIQDPKNFFKVILSTSKNQNEIRLGLKGLLAFIQTCLDLEVLLSQAENIPLLQSAIWHYHSYWFGHLKAKMGKELKEALAKFQKWEEFSGNKEVYRSQIQGSLKGINDAMSKLLDGHYGKRLNEYAQALRQKSARRIKQIPKHDPTTIESLVTILPFKTIELRTAVATKIAGLVKGKWTKQNKKKGTYKGSKLAAKKIKIGGVFKSKAKQKYGR
jgi:hypothetical protein